jgi:hypothetical protein
MRVGKYERAISWGELSLSNIRVLVNFGFAVPGAVGTVMAYAMTGTNRKRAQELILQTRSELAGRAPTGALQAWALSSADAYSIMGEECEAEKEAIRGIGLQATPQGFCAGQYARWLAKSSSTLIARREAYKHLARLMEALSTYDALDQAEILNAKCWLDNRERRLAVKDLEAMIDHLTALPPAVTQQLKKIGMLDFLEPVWINAYDGKPLKGRKTADFGEDSP